MLQQSNLDVLLHSPPPLVCPADVRFLSLHCSNKDVLCTCCVAIELDPIKLVLDDRKKLYTADALNILKLYLGSIILCYWLRNASVGDAIS